MSANSGGRGKRSAPPRPIGFHGRHDHGRPLDDPVYPSKHVPASLLPQFPQDWRSAGRALLCMGMAALEGTRLRSKGAVLKWQRQCRWGGEQVAKSPNRIMCSWRLPGSVQEHHSRLDDLLCSYKGEVLYSDVKKPIWRVRNQVALKNRFQSERMVWDAGVSSYAFADREHVHPAFGIRFDRDETRYKPGEATYDSDSDDEATSTDEDSDGDGCA